MIEPFRGPRQSLRVCILVLREERFLFDQKKRNGKSFFEVIVQAYSHAIQNGNSDSYAAQNYRGYKT